MSYEFKLPDLGEGLTEGEIARWLVEEGQDIAEDEPLVEIATDKTTVEIPSPAGGKVARILVAEGEVVPVGTVLVVIGEDRAGPATEEQPSAEPTPSVSAMPGGLSPGHVQRYDIWPQYVERVLSFVDVSAIKPLRIVIDAANGMAGAMLPPVLEWLPQVQAQRNFFAPDGTFPNHEPNPLLPENREFIIAKTLEERADFGVAFDGDSDRCFFVDDTGEFVPGDFATALFAESILAREPGAKIIYDVRASWAVPETIRGAGGIPLVNRVGHAFIKHRMREENAAFAGEVSGHYYFRDFSQADSGVIPFLLMLELVSKRGKRLSEILRPFRERYFITGELNTPVDDVDAPLQDLKERFGSEGRVIELDGISVEAQDWHMNVRPSNTEPLLRLNLEARSRELMERKRDEVLALIRA